jgi:uncharacterized membrane protein
MVKSIKIISFALLILINFLIWYAIKLEIPYFRQFICFAYLILMPGSILIKILRLKYFCFFERLVYIIGLSISFVIIIGLIINTIYLLLNIPDSISIVPLMTTINIAVIILYTIHVTREWDYPELCWEGFRKSLETCFSRPAFLCYLLPVLSIIGSNAVNYYNNNAVFFALIIIVFIIIILIGFELFNNKSLYPLAIFSIALSLIFYRTLITTFISGTDIHQEYYVSNLVIRNATWDFSFLDNYNSVLSVAIFVPVISVLCNIGLDWVLKICCGLILSIVPLCIYFFCLKQSNGKLAIFSSFLFVGGSYFYTNLPVMVKQQISMLFFVLLILLMVDRQIGKVVKTVMLIIFGFSLSTTHYGLTYIYVLFVAAGALAKKLNSSYKSKKACAIDNPAKFAERDSVITTTFIFFMIVVSLSWYMYIAKSSSFDAIARFFMHVIDSVVNDFSTTTSIAEKLNEAKQVTISLTILNLINIVINYFIRLCVIVGFVSVLLKPENYKFNREYIAFSIPAFLAYLSCIAPPFISPILSGSMDLSRIVNILFLVLSPYCILGIIFLIRVMIRVIKAKREKNVIGKVHYVLISLVLSLYFIFQTGFVFELACNGSSNSVSIGQEGIRKNGTLEQRITMYDVLTLKQDVLGAEWLGKYRVPQEKIYATYNDIRVHTLTSYGMIPVRDVSKISEKAYDRIEKGAYVYLQPLNIIEGWGTEFDAGAPRGMRHTYFRMDDMYYHLSGEKSKIYSNGGSEIYK